MNQIEDLPRDRTFGLEFDYTRWSGKTSYAAMYQVPWSSDYRDIVPFPTHQQLHTFLDTRPSNVQFGFSYLKYNQPVRVDVPMNEALKYNYLVVWNDAQPIGTSDSNRWLYYFINDVIYDSPRSTRLVLQLDAVQTFLREVQFGQVYAEQGHVGVAENTVTLGSQGILTQPEGLNLGADYVVAAEMGHTIASANEGNYNVLVVSTTNLEAAPGTKTDPNLETATGSDFENLPNGTNIYIFESPEVFKSYMNVMAKFPWVTQGIVSVTAIPGSLEQNTWPTVTLEGHQALKPTKDSLLKTTILKGYPDFREKILFEIPARYKHLKKFTVYPYSFMEVSTYAGEPLVLKPELWGDDDATFVIKYHLAPPSPRIGIRPYNYNSSYKRPIINGTDPDKTDGGEVWNVATWLANFPQFTIVNSGYLQTMASQAHSISQSYKDAGWQQQKALSGNAMSYDQASAGMNLANDMTQNSVTSMAQQTSLANTTTGARAISTGIQQAGGAAQNLVAGGGVGAVAGGAMQVAGTAMDAAITINQQTQSSAIQQRLANQQNQAQVGNQGFVRDTNKNYADFATKGDYQNQVNTINAKVEDAKLTQPTTAGTTGGDAFMLAIDGWRIRLRIKMVPKGARQSIGEYWLRYGYAINRFIDMPVNYQCMTVFTYWKVKESYIISAQCPEPIKQALRGIFEKGVTVWHDPYQMGTTGALTNNKPIPKNYIPQLD